MKGLDSRPNLAGGRKELDLKGLGALQRLGELFALTLVADSSITAQGYSGCLFGQGSLWLWR